MKLMKLLKGRISREEFFELCLYMMVIAALLAIMSCSKADDISPTPKPIVKDEAPKQYDTPFTNVPSTEDIIMYEVNLWAFSQSGDLNGVTARLDHLRELGVNVVWLMPVYEIGQEKGVGSPYAVKNYKKINPSFGNLENLRTLVKEAHTRDMAVIMDWVANHTSWDNEWIKNTSWYTRDGSGKIISPEGMGWNDVADLNFNSSAMRKEMISAMKYWVLEANIDGYRCDYAAGVPTDFWKQAIDTLRKIPNRDLIMFAEADKKDLLGAGFDLIFGWNFFGKLKEVFENNTSVSTVVNAHTAEYTSVPAGKHILRWTTNHDVNAWEDTPINTFKGQDGALAAFVVTSYLGGVPMLYNGQEIGFTTKIPFFQNSSVKIDWSLNPSILDQYKKLIAFRRSSTAVKSGTMETFHNTDVMAFKKKSGTEEVVVIANLRNSEKSLTLPESLKDSEWTNMLSNESVTLESSVILQGFEYIILKK